MFFMFIYITVVPATYILSVLLHLLYMLTFFFANTFFRVLGDTIAPTLASPLIHQQSETPLFIIF